MALIDKISNVLGFGGATPNKRSGATKAGDLHYDPKSLGHSGGHTNLELGGTPTKYTDNTPK